MQPALLTRFSNHPRLGLGRGTPCVHFSRWKLRDPSRRSCEEDPRRATISNPRPRFHREVHQSRVPPAHRVQLLFCKRQGRRGQHYSLRRRRGGPACRGECADPTAQGPNRRSGLAAAQDWRRCAGRPCDNPAITHTDRIWSLCPNCRRAVPTQLLDCLLLLLDSLRGWTMLRRGLHCVYEPDHVSTPPFPAHNRPEPLSTVLCLSKSLPF